MSDVLVSVIVPTYNVAPYVEQCIRSLLDQTYRNVEVCVYDDGSTDGTPDIVAGISDSRINLRVSRVNKGAPAGYNGALALATGAIIARTDSDDWNELTRLEKQVRFLTSTNYDIVTCRMMYHYPTYNSCPPNKGMQAGLYIHGDPQYGPQNASIVAWRYVYDNIGPFDERMTASPDGDWNFRALLQGYKWGHIDEVLYHYRRHSEQVTARMRQKQTADHKEAHKKWTS